MEYVRIIDFPDCKMVSSGSGLFGEEGFDRFDKWLSKQPRFIYPHDFLGDSEQKGKFEWFYLYSPGLDTEGLDVVDFKGGLYAVVTGIDAQSNADEMAAVDALIEKGGFEHDNTRRWLGNVITPPSAKDALGYNQMDYYVPVKVRVKI